MLSGQDPEPVREQDDQLLGRLSPVLHPIMIIPFAVVFVLIIYDIKLYLKQTHLI